MNEPAVKLYASQRRYVQDRSRFKACMQARQTGKTFGSTLEIVNQVLEQESGGGRQRWVILSRGERQAKEAMGEGIKRHFHAYGAAFDSLEVPWEGAKEAALEVRLPNGSCITGVPANPDTARGFTANVLLDEFGFHADSKKIWAALFPVISRPDLSLRVISTPNGKANKFYELISQANDADLRREGHIQAGVWSLHFCDIYRAVREGLPRNIEELRQGLNDADIWAQEFELQWLDEASAWLSFELINTCEADYAGDPSLYQGGPVYVGNDIAAVRDLFVLYVVEDVGGELITREIITARRKSFAEQDELLDGVMNRYDVRGLWMDKTGMGMKPVEDATRRYGEHRVHGVMFTPASKQELATKGKQAFEDRRIKIPMGDQALRSDLHKLKREVSATGMPRFVAERDSTGHADRAWACFLAISAASAPFLAPAGETVDPTPETMRPVHGRPTSGGMFGRLKDRLLGRTRTRHQERPGGEPAATPSENSQNGGEPIPERSRGEV